MVKNLPANAGDTRDIGLIPGSGRSPGAGNGNPLQYSCLENPHGQRSLVGYNPWGCKELDVTERLSTHTHISYIYSCVIKSISCLSVKFRTLTTSLQCALCFFQSKLAVSVDTKFSRTLYLLYI